MVNRRAACALALVAFCAAVLTGCGATADTSSEAGAGSSSSTTDQGTSQKKQEKARTDKAAQEKAQKLALRNACFLHWDFLLSGDPRDYEPPRSVQGTRLFQTWARRSGRDDLVAAAVVLITGAQHPQNPPAEYDRALRMVGDRCGAAGYGDSYWSYEADLDDPSLPTS